MNYWDQPVEPVTETDWLMMTEHTDFDISEDHRDIVALAVDALPADQRALIEAIFYEGASYSELGDRLGYSKVHAWRLTQTALASLRSALTGDPQINERYGMTTEPTDWADAAGRILLQLDKSTVAIEGDVDACEVAISHLRSALAGDGGDVPTFFKALAREAYGHLLWLFPKNSALHLPSWIKAILIKKQHDYGHDNINAFGLFGLTVRLSDKVARLRNLTSRGEFPSNESLVDTWVDIVGYCVIAEMLLNDTFQLELKEAS